MEALKSCWVESLLIMNLDLGSILCGEHKTLGIISMMITQKTGISVQAFMCRKGKYIVEPLSYYRIKQIHT